MFYQIDKNLNVITTNNTIAAPIEVPQTVKTVEYNKNQPRPWRFVLNPSGAIYESTASSELAAAAECMEFALKNNRL